jgi:hypothetical protein
MAVAEESATAGEVFKLGTVAAGIRPRHFLPRARTQQVAEQGQPRLEEAAVETGGMGRPESSRPS